MGFQYPELRPHQTEPVSAQPGFVQELYSTGLYAAVVAPISGVTQIFDAAKGTHITQNLADAFQFIGVQAPTQHDFASSLWLADTIGSGLGMVVPTSIIGGRVRAYMGDAAKVETGIRRSVIGLSVKESLVTGAIYGAVFSPTQGENLLPERLTSGATGSATFGLFSLGSIGLGSFAASRMAARFGLDGALKNSIVNGIVSGVPGGFVNAEVDALKDKRYVPHWGELGKSITQMSILGGVFGAKPHVGKFVSSLWENKPVSLESLKFVDQAQPTSLPSKDSRQPGASPLDALVKTENKPEALTQGEEKASEPRAFEVVRALRAETRTLLEHKEVQDLLNAKLDAAPALPGYISRLIQPNQIPEAKGLWEDNGYGQVAPYRLGTLVRDNTVGALTVHDRANDFVRTFDNDQRLVAAHSIFGGKVRGNEYIHDDNGDLRAILTDRQNGWFRTKTGWSQGTIDGSTKKFGIYPSEHSFAAIDPDGGFFVGTADSARSVPLNGRYKHIDQTGLRNTSVDLQREKKILNRLELAIRDQPSRERTAQLLRDVTQEANKKNVAIGRKLLPFVNQELTAGNVNVIHLLDQTSKLLQGNDLRQFNLRQNTNGEYVMSVSGYSNGTYHEVHADGTRIRDENSGRVTTKPDQSTESYDPKTRAVSKLDPDGRLVGQKVEWKSRGLFERALEYQTEYKNDKRISRVEDQINGLKNVLSLEGKSWTLTQEMEGHPALTKTRQLGPGEVIIDGTRAKFVPELAQSKRVVLDAYGLVTRAAGARTREMLTVAADDRIIQSDLEYEQDKTTRLAQSAFRKADGTTSRTRAQVRESRGRADDYIDSVTKLLNVSRETNVPPESTAIMLRVLNEQLQINPSRSRDLAETMKSMLETSPNRAFAAFHTDSATRIELGNKDITLPNDGTAFTIKPVLVRVHEPLSAKGSWIEEAQNKLSPAIINLLEQNNSSIRVGSKVTSVFPDRPPTAWPPDRRVDHVDALYDASQNTAAVFEKFKATIDFSSRLGKNDNPQSSFFNATGRAVDHALGWFSESHAFTDAYNKDLDRLPYQRYPDVYQLPGGRQETFAEIFAVLHDAPVDAATKKFMEERFPDTVQTVSRRLADLEVESKTEHLSKVAPLSFETLTNNGDNGDGIVAIQNIVSGHISSRTKQAEAAEGTVTGDSAIATNSHLTTQLEQSADAKAVSPREDPWANSQVPLELRKPNPDFTATMVARDDGLPAAVFRDGDRLVEFRTDEIVRRIGYDGNSEINTINEHRLDNSQVTWTREGATWTRLEKTWNGEERRLALGEGEASVAEDGNITLTLRGSATRSFHILGKEITVGQIRIVLSKEGVEELHTPDGRVEVRKTNGRIDFTHANLPHELDLARDSFARGQPIDSAGTARIKRFEKLLGSFQAAAEGSGMPKERQALVMLQLNRLMSDKPDAPLSAPQRADLAEQMLNHLRDPLVIAQGDNPTCNVTTIEKRLAVLAPDKLAQVLSDMTLNGKYVYTDGLVTTSDMLIDAFKPDKEAGKNLVLQKQGGKEISQDGLRDWASQIIQSTIVNGAWHSDFVYVANDTILPPSSIGYVPDGATGQMMAVRVDPDQFAPIDQKIVDKEVVANWFGNKQGMIAKDDMIPLYSKEGERLNFVPPGGTAYDASLNPVVTRTAAGEMSYGRVANGASALSLVRDGKITPLIMSDELVRAPSLTVDALAAVYRRISGDNPTVPFVFLRGHHSLPDVWSVSTANELAESITKLEKANQLPGLLRVHTDSELFSFWGGGELHLINVYGLDPVTNKVRYSNQWGSWADRMEQGVDLDKLFAATTAARRPNSAANLPPIPPADPRLFRWLKLD